VNDLHGIVFAYHSHRKLGELTRPRNTCSLPFGGRYRLIDFNLSNLVNAGVTDVGLIVHESYQSLLDHIGSGKDWELSRKHGGLRILPPFGYAEKGGGEYRGSMDALSGVQSYLQNIRQPYVILAWGDMALNFSVSDMYQQHIDSGADITVACASKICDLPSDCEYVKVDETGRINDLIIHPVKVMEDELESLEIYIMSKQLLLDLVENCAVHNQYNLSRNVLRPNIEKLNIRAYVHNGYVARFPAVATYFANSMDLLDPAVQADLFNPARPIRTKDQSNPSTYYGPDARSINSLVADGCIIEGEIENCILSRGVVVRKGAKISNCVLMQGTVVEENVSMSYTIADKNVHVTAGQMLVGHRNAPLAIAKHTVV